VSELEPERLCPILRSRLGEPYLHVSETSSTQDLLRGSDAPHGAVAVAEHQTAGRGRSGRRWDDVPSTALLFSVLLRPPATAPLPQLSHVAGLAVAAAIERETGVRTVLRWPNDVLVDSRKVAGILLEASDAAVVCGIGINVNQEERDLPSVTRTPATSLRIVVGRPFDRGIVLASVLVELERRYAEWVDGGLACLADEVEQRNSLRGQRVRVAGLTGTAGAIAPDGRLTIVLDNGESMLVGSGEVELGPE
jgi:BirA family biotin operon repressor/biotin-[acetyl-CoA-carboxylase] ligase